MIVLCAIYIILWRYIVPRTNKYNDNDKNSNTFWIRSYYDIATKESISVNPLFEQQYQSEVMDNDRCEMIINEQLKLSNTSFDIKKIAKDEAENSAQGKVVRPNVPERYMETIHYYSLKHQNWSDTHDNIQTVQNVVSFLIIMFLVSSELYETALVVLINRSSMFGILTSYSDMKRCEKSSEQSMEKIVKILDAVDKQLELSNTKIIQIIDPDTNHDTRVRLETIFIKEMKINISSAKINTDTDTDTIIEINSGNEENETSKDSLNNRYISLTSAEISITPHKCLLLEGRTGCGKSVTINALAGLYSEKICSNMNVTLRSGKTIDAEFNQLLGSRCYISQLLSDDYKYNGKIDMPLYKLFPEAKDINQISSFLKDVFSFKDSCIPLSLEEPPHSKLSGGEVQRYIVASQIWRILKIRPDIVIMDEIDRALDKETAVQIVSWIVENISCFFIIVSHLTEVKQMLFDKNYVSQIWTYDESDICSISIKSQIM